MLTCRQYADDTSIYHCFKPAGLPQSITSMQATLEKLENWSDHSNLIMNPEKTKTKLISTVQMSTKHISIYSTTYFWVLWKFFFHVWQLCLTNFLYYIKIILFHLKTFFRHTKKYCHIVNINMLNFVNILLWMYFFRHERIIFNLKIFLLHDILI